MSTKHYSPALARRLRGVIGVDERVLKRVPEEGARYTRLGALVCLTATFSALSMLVVTSRLFTGGLAWLGAGAVAVFWGAFILAIDSWLVSSLHGARRAKTLVYLPRLLISLLLGCVIAEPLVVMVFRPAIEQQVSDNREAELAADSSRWRTCNPPTDDVVDSPECDDYRLNLADSPSTLRDRLVALHDERDTEAADLDRDTSDWQHLETIARNECAGVAGPGTTGVPGEGAECTRNREKADQARRDARLEQRQEELATLDGQIGDLQGELTASEAEYGERVRNAIDEKADEWRASRQTVGILEELDALGQLSATSVPVAVAHWVLRVLLVMLDCMPVLAKWMTGATAYDRVIRRRTESNVTLHDKHIARREEIESIVEDAHKAELVREPRAVLDEQSEADRRANSERERLQDEEIERLAELYRRQLT